MGCRNLGGKICRKTKQVLRVGFPVGGPEVQMALTPPSPGVHGRLGAVHDPGAGSTGRGSGRDPL